MPKLQIQSSKVRYPNETVYESLNAFISAFEMKLDIHCMLDTTLCNKKLTWKEACKKIREEFGNPFHMYKEQEELFKAQPLHGESIHDYTQRWLALAEEAEWENGSKLAFCFITSLPQSIYTKIYPVLKQVYGTNFPNDVTKVSQLVVSTIGENIDSNIQDNTSSSQNNKKRHLPDDEPPHQKSKRKYGSCPIHPRGHHSASECSILQKQKDIVSQQLKQAKPKNTLCKFCNKVPYEPGHKCQEFYDFKKNKNNTYHNRSVHVSHDKNKYKTERNQNLLDEILLPSKMDGMDITEVKNISVSLAAKNTSANLLGLIENVKIFYNAGETLVTIGLDLMSKLGISIIGLTTSWQKTTEKKEEKVDDTVQH
ncbi:hypothetical protein BDA99DRAFT_577519 [Phascolomyces articulosus]|uniref:Retrotransposon gag domain-containing protein n=1 Tax=Phascolomyces articulosus TaxID=60185 RepID=A0AAD5JKC6_9FUNG|nr:hypothetical protein BDA99DRAFT_577519 [Phascolomyces articulosus]